jgi:signal transduction histidine kinase
VRQYERPTRNDNGPYNLPRNLDFPAVLLAMAGHDLRQPLQVIMATYSWLGRQHTKQPDRKYIERGELAIAQLAQQLDQLVEALRLHEGAATINLVPVPLEQLLADLCRENGEAAAHGGVELRRCATGVAVMSDAVLLKSILRNLIRNALKYTPPGGCILVGCRRRGSRVGIEVHDTGIGIPSDHLSNVFEAFHRLDTTRPDGLGLGLFVVRRAVELLGHCIDVRSAVGRGSRFSILAQAAVDPLVRSGTAIVV